MGLKSEKVDVFLCHDAEDAALAAAVEYRLNECGVSCRAPVMIDTDKRFTKQLLRALDDSRSFVVLLSKRYAQKQPVFVQVGAAWAAKVPVFLLLSDLHRSDIPEFFRRFPSFQLWTGFSQLVGELQETQAPVNA